MPEKKTPMSLPAIIKQEMMHDIMSGRLRPGDKIIEEEYAHKLNVSRAPVREAMLMLITDGLATKIQNRGTVLRAYSLDEHIDLYHIRYFIEKQSLEKIRLIDDILPLAQQFEVMLANMRAEKDDLRKINILNEFYHYKFIIFSGSPTFVAAYPSIYISAQLLQYPEYVAWLTDMASHFSEHQAVATAMAHKDFTEITRVIDTHHQDITRLLANIQSQQPQA
ncbi:MAG: GntR family transcriptional regulator [Neisseriaceae bacterium]|nr:GntR family transcriptional regulator [Neisseriaceae bacterium]